MSRDFVATMESVLTFGKHKGRKVRNVVQDDPNWLVWAQDNVDWFALDEEVEEAVSHD